MKKVARRVKAVTWRMGYVDRETGKVAEDVLTSVDGTDYRRNIGKFCPGKGMCYSAHVDSEETVSMSMDINDFVRYATPVAEKTEEEEEDNE